MQHASEQHGILMFEEKNVLNVWTKWRIVSLRLTIATDGTPTNCKVLKNTLKMINNSNNVNEMPRASMKFEPILHTKTTKNYLILFATCCKLR